MPELLISRRDVEFLLYEWLRVLDLTSRPRFAEHSRETFDAALRTYEKIAMDEFATHNRKGDLNEPRFDGERVAVIPEVGRALDVFIAAGLMGAGHDGAYAGMQLPCAVERAGFAYLAAANVSTAGYPFLTIANANLILAHGSSEQIDLYARPEIEGRFFGTMCLSEPQAGSSLGNIRTRAVAQADGTYRIFGNKMWISGGDHELADNIVHLVLAKISDQQGRLPSGSQGLSLFIVPKFLVEASGPHGERNDVVLVGLNHKMGMRGIVNTVLNFGEGRYQPRGATGAIGFLIGKPGKGLAQMFHMMNEARIGVGLIAAALGYTGFLHALDYARNRVQGRSLDAKNSGVAPVRIIAHPDVKRMLLLQKAYAEGSFGLILYCARLVDDTKTSADPQERARAALLLDILTPIAKSWPSQWCLEANSLAIQVHGGYGYTRDYKVEQFYRDNRLNPIHEGTHGIQALDLLGRKVQQQNGACLDCLDIVIEATVDRARRIAADRLGGMAELLHRYWNDLRTLTVDLKVDGLAAALTNATPYMEGFGHIVIGWIWLEQAATAAQLLETTAYDGDRAFLLGKIATAQYFFAWELPRAQVLLGPIRDTTAAQMPEDWF